MAMTMQLVFFLYILVSFTVCKDVFKLVNSSVQLDIQKKNGTADKDIDWTFKAKSLIVRYNGNPPSRIFGGYKDRVEFNEETYSLTLKNLQKSDSGIYEAEAADERKEVVAKYQLHVFDPVQKPVLTASHQQSDDFCNVTLTCEAQNLSVTSHCYNDTCDMKETKTSGDMFLSLSLYASNSSIICNHSNPVSWKTMEIKYVKKLCYNKDKDISESDKAYKRIVSTNLIIISVISVISVIIFTSFIIFWLRKRRTNSVNTIYEEVDAKSKGGKKAESVEMSENHAAPSTVYYTVGMPAHANSNDESTGMDIKKVPPSDSKFCETHQNEGGEWKDDSVDLPQTIYSTVNKAGKPV